MQSLDDVPLKIAEYADMALRERFVDALDPKAHKLASILAEYHLAHDIECALTDCRTPHRHGLLVLTEDDIETNIGCDCGARYFPEQYDALRKSFNVRRARAAHMDVITEYVERASAYSKDIDVIWYEDCGGEWADRCHRQYTSMCPAGVRENISRLARSGSWTISIQLRISEDEKDDDVGLGYRRDQEYEEKRIGVLRGGPALLKTVASVLRPLRATMAEYEGVDPSTLSAPSRRKWADWSRTIPATLNEARTLVSLSRELYVSANLEQLSAFARGKDERKALKAFIRAVAHVETVRRAKAG
jgi:hypothetical protein